MLHQYNLSSHRSASFVLSDPKEVRTLRTKVRLHHAALDYIHANPSCASLGPDPLVSQMVAAKGLGEQVAVLRLIVGGRVFTAICVPTSTWRDEFSKASLLEIKAEAAHDRTRCILVPQCWLRGGTRAHVAKALAKSRNVKFTDLQVSRVVQLISRERITTLSACAAELDDHQDPFGAVFGMCCAGIVDIDRTRPVSSSSWVSARFRLSH